MSFFLARVAYNLKNYNSGCQTLAYVFGMIVYYDQH